MPPLKLQIDLENTPHPVSRKLLVPPDVKMTELHTLLQLAMGWENYHLWEFTDAKGKGTLKVSIPSGDDFGFGNQEVLNAKEVSLQAVFLEENGAKPFWYMYDFGDGWWHKISFLKTNKKDREAFKGQPLCVGATGNCPPEDCGGPGGYAHFLEAITSPEHEEHQSIRNWAGLEKGDIWLTVAPPLKAINHIIQEHY